MSMKLNIGLAFLALLLPGFAFGEMTSGSSNASLKTLATTASQEIKNIGQGHSEVGGSLTMGYSSLSGGSIQANPRFQYFVLNRLSLGASLDYFRLRTRDNTAVGPSLSFYFWEKERWASYLAQTVMWDTRGGVPYGTSTVGLNDFLTPSVALGFSLNHSYSFGKTSFSEGFSSLRANFLVYF